MQDGGLTEVYFLSVEHGELEGKLALIGCIAMHAVHVHEPLGMLIGFVHVIWLVAKVEHADI